MRSQVIGEDQTRFPGRGEDEEEKPATERSREYTDLGLVLARERESMSSALAMTDEARREAEM